MKAQYLLKLGPVELKGDAVNVYLRVKESGEVAPPVFGLSDLEGLRELVTDESLSLCRCEPALEEAAKSLGLEIAPPTARALQSRAAIAVFMAWGQRGVSGAGSEMALLLMQAATEFWNAHPWVYWDERQPIRFVFHGAVEHAYEGSIFGSKEQGFGLALYEDVGALEQLLALQATGDIGMARKLPAIGVMLDDRPPYAVEALQAAKQVPRLPIPIKTGESGAAVPTAVECLALIAALRASSVLTASVRTSTCDSGLRGLKLSVEVQAPPARVRN
jgi:hypothetical protein